MSSPLMFVRDGRTLPFIPVTTAALDAIRRHTPKRRPYAIATYMALLEFANEHRSDRVALTHKELTGRVGAARSTVRVALEDLAAAGLLRIIEQQRGGARVENEYLVIEPSPPGAISGAVCRVTADPLPSDGQLSQEEQQEEPPPLSENGSRAEPEKTTAVVLGEQLVTREAETARGEILAPPRFGRETVPPTLLEDATHALNYYCERTGQRLKALDALGQPTESLKRIIGAMRKHPEVRTIYRRMIDNTLASGWWGDGDPHTGTIFGRGILEQSIQWGYNRPAPGSNMRLTPTGQAIRALRLASGESVG